LSDPSLAARRRIDRAAREPLAPPPDEHVWWDSCGASTLGVMAP
jgi:hypothetical protein